MGEGEGGIFCFSSLPPRILKNMDYETITECRICQGNDLKEYLDLGWVPLSNGLLASENELCKSYPLKVLFCQTCFTSQLSITVDPEILYSDYPYRSSVSNTFREHCSEMAASIKPMLKDNYSPSMIDIGSNDGCLLEEFKKNGYSVWGVEPCTQLANLSKEKEITTTNKFWSYRAAQKIPVADVVTVTNCFAHIDDLYHFMIAVTSRLSKPNGILVIEVPYLYDLLSQNRFDTIYHEHLFYFLLKPLQTFLYGFEMTLFRVERHPIHGGSIRIYAAYYKNINTAEKSVTDMIEFEKTQGLYEFESYIKYAEKFEKMKHSFRELITGLKNEGFKIAGYGAAAKGINLLNYCGIDCRSISYIADDTKSKQGKTAPGCRISIVGPERFYTEKPDYILILPWNFENEMIGKVKHIEAKIILPSVAEMLSS